MTATSPATELSVSSTLQSKLSSAKKVLQESPVYLNTKKTTRSRTVLRCKGKRAWATETTTALIVLQQAEEEFLKSCFLASSACRLLARMPRSPGGPCQIQRPFLSARQLIKMLSSATEKRAASRKVPIRSSTHVDIMQS